MSPLPLVPVTDPDQQFNFDRISLQFPVGPGGLMQVPQARVYNSANISINNTTFTALTFDTERYDTGGIHSTSANTDRLTCVIPGLYDIWGGVYWASAGTRVLQIYLNGATVIAYDENTAAQGQTLSTQYRLVAGDFVSLRVWQNSGGALNVLTGANYSPEFAMHWAGT